MLLGLVKEDRLREHFNSFNNSVSSQSTPVKPTSYIACSDDSDEGFCSFVNTSCMDVNICRTCSPLEGCRAVKTFPNATVTEYGTYHYDTYAMMAGKRQYIKG